MKSTPFVKLNVILSELSNYTFFNLKITSDLVQVKVQDKLVTNHINLAYQSSDIAGKDIVHAQRKSP